jgi:nitroreductase
MDVLEAIRTRRTAGAILPDAPPREVIEELLEAATWAPNHHLNEPWRFFVLAGEARERFGEAMAADAVGSLPDPNSEQAKALAESQLKKAVRSPVIIAVVVDPPTSTRIDVTEDVCAVACGIQNLLLAAHARGLATKWSTGKTVYSEKIKAFFGLTPAHQILGFIYLGYPAQEQPASKRLGHREKATWLGWDGR